MLCYVIRDIVFNLLYADSLLADPTPVRSMISYC